MNRFDRIMWLGWTQPMSQRGDEMTEF